MSHYGAVNRELLEKLGLEKTSNLVNAELPDYPTNDDFSKLRVFSRSNFPPKLRRLR